MMKNDQLRYLFVTRTLTGGGAERFVATFASFMADQGYDVHILTYETSDKDYLLSPKVKVHVMPPIETSIKGKFLRIATVQKEIKAIAPDVVIPFVDTVVTCAYIANLHLRKKFVFTVRVSPWHEEGSVFSKAMRKVIARTTDAIMLQNEEQAEYFPSAYRNRMYVVPNPVARKFNTCSKEHYADKLANICTMGRLDAQKNFLLLMSAVKNVTDKGASANLKIYGEGVQRQYLEEMLTDLDLADVCHLMGRTTDVEGVLKEADLFVLSSDYEGMPNALIEAMAMGVPCISSDCRTGPKSLIKDGQTGLLFRTGDADSLTEKLVWALAHPSEMNDMGKAAREDVLVTYRIENTLQTFLKMIDGIFSE